MTKIIIGIIFLAGAAYYYINHGMLIDAGESEFEINQTRYTTKSIKIGFKEHVIEVQQNGSPIMVCYRRLDKMGCVKR